MVRNDDSDIDRQLTELTSELRVLLAAMAVLFAFLLTLPFSGGLQQVSAVDRKAL